jgi:transcription termination/antitermination protein NusA
MMSPLQQLIDTIAKEKNIEPTVIISAIEDAVLAASRKAYKSNENLKARFNPESGQVDLFAVKQIVDTVNDPALEVSLSEAQQLYGEEAEVDMEIEFPKPTDVLGRIAAQTAKQVIFQKVREAERENIFAEYNQRIGEVVNATAKRFENGDMIAEISGRVEAAVPRKEQSRAESYNPGDRLRAVIKGVNRSTKGPQIVLSRTDPALLIKLFEQEVPEIYDGTVMIRGAVREAGDRAKVAVYSRERDVDPVGACVGMKGTRVQAIIRELRGEKIDIVEFSDDPVAFVTSALSPAKVQRVSIVDDREKVMEIGKKGQNVRLAAKLTGWRIDIKSEEEKRREIELQLEGLAIGTPAADAGETAEEEAPAAEISAGAEQAEDVQPSPADTEPAADAPAADIHAEAAEETPEPEAR